ncbi:MAG: zinc-ribbon domain-containing protein [Promethearchaeota archaeon]
MANLDYSQVFSCPRCGYKGAIYIVKIAGANIVFKQRCPTHGGRSFKLPLVQKDLYLPQVHDGIFRCFKCGQPATVDSMRISGPWALIRCLCANHGNKLPYQKIWSSIYTEVANMGATIPQAKIPQPEPLKSSISISEESESISSEEKKFCPNCGTPLDGSERFCGSCGEEID